MRNVFRSYLWLTAAMLVGCGDDTQTQVVELTTPEETALALPLIQTHPSSSAPKYTVTMEPEHGSIEGSFPIAVYTPAADYNGDDAIVVRVDDDNGTVDLTLQISVTPVNDAPTATADVFAGTEDTTQMIPTSTLIGNDRDVDGDTLTIIGVPTVRFGAATLHGDHVTFTPASNFNGSATLTYTVSDGNATATGVVTISVGLVNDAPVAENDYLSTDQNTALEIDPYQLIGNDTDVDSQSLTVTEVGTADHGTVVLGKGITFTPPTDFTGDATFTYTVSDGALTATGQCTVTVNAISLPD
ncbi:MAG: tandem-95 repeat protein [Kofleriaceae bacterium]|nr:tandem-95 repeat protein [Kofleriaceae bacterium]